MDTPTRFPRRGAALMAGFGLVFCASAAQSTEAAISGRIHRVKANTLDLCFDRGHNPAVGDHVQLIRHAFTSQPKSVQTMKSTTIGAAEIVALEGGRCASARLLEGSARALDWVAAQP
ncbi:MAG TPA: hypothetical protein VGC55_05005, partial [Dokdonella sp.]